MNTQLKRVCPTSTHTLHPLLPLVLGASMVATSFSAFPQTPATQSNQPAMSSETAKSGMPTDMRGSMMNMRKTMDALKATGDIDYDFAVMMRAHHQGAVDMAELELKEGKDPELKKMAKEIIAAQEKEIAKFDEWLAAHKKESR